MDDLRANVVSRDRLAMLLLGAFAGMALMLVASGIFGVVSYASAQRTREFGIRMALGANRTQVRALVLSQPMIPVAIGLGIGMAGAFVLTRLMTNLLFRIEPFDPLTYTSVTAFPVAVAASACVLPRLGAPPGAIRFALCVTNDGVRGRWQCARRLGRSLMWARSYQCCCLAGIGLVLACAPDSQADQVSEQDTSKR